MSFLRVATGARSRSILLAAVLAAGVLAPSAASGAPPEASLPAHAPLPGIVIEGDDGFRQPGSGVRSGSGTQDDPYRIERWTLVSPHNASIRLMNTRAHVVISEVVFEDFSRSWLGGVRECGRPLIGCGTEQAVIDLVDAHNVRVERLQLGGGDAGIRLVAVRNVIVEDVVLGEALVAGESIHSLETGIRVRSGENVTLRGLSIQSSVRWPIAVEDAENLSVESSSIAGPSDVVVAHNRRVSFVDNDLRDVTLRVERHARDLFVAHNRFEGAGARSHTAFVYEPEYRPDITQDSLVLCDNTFSQATEVAANIWHARNVHVKGNRFLDGHKGLLVSSAQAIVERNLFANNTYRALFTSWGGEFHHNSFEGNARGAYVASNLSNFTQNWYGDASGPSGVHDGDGDSLHVRDASVQWQPWLTQRPTLSVTCERLDSAPIPPPPPTRVIEFELQGGAAVQMRLRHGNWTEWWLETLWTTSDLQESQLALMAHSPTSGTTSRFVGDFRFLGETGSEAFGHDARVTPVVEGSTTFGMGTGGASWLGDHTHLLMGGASNGIERTTVRLHLTGGDDAVVDWAFTNRTGLTTLRDFDSATPSAYARVSGVGVATSTSATASVAVTEGMWGFTRYERGVVDSHVFTLQRPDQQPQTADDLTLLGEPAGEYRARLTQRAAGSHMGAWWLWADFRPAGAG